MLSNVFVHTPVQLLDARLNFLLNRRLQPEVACQEASLDQLDQNSIKDCAAALKQRKLATTLHAPFAGFNPGSPKKRIREQSHLLCKQSFQLAEQIDARRIVFHPGIPYQAPPATQSRWLELALEFWPEYIEMAKNLETVICIENIYERSSSIFRELFSHLGGSHFGHCFDIGHWNIFAEESLADWFDAVGQHIRHIHLHDNNGNHDQHLPIASGEIDFKGFLHHYRALPQIPSMTLEAHSIPDLETSLQQLELLLEN